MFHRIRRKLGSLLVLTMLLTSVYSPYAQAAQENGYSSLWNYIGRGWELQDEGQETVKAAWVCDDEITENGKNTWYLIDENGLLITDRLIHVTYDGTDGYYLINQNNDGHFGCMLYEDGVYDGVNVQFSHDHDGSLGRIRDPRAIEELKKRFPVREVSFLTKSSENRYTSVIRSRLRAASEEDQYDNTEVVSDRTTGEVHIHHYDNGEVTRDPNCLIKGVRVFACEECGSTRAEYIGKIPHVYPASPSEAVEPDCKSDGYSIYYCEVCGHAKVAVTSATGHSFNAENICTVCGEGKEEEHTHVFEAATPSDHVKEPTCGEDGLERLCCECGASRLEIVPATGLHEWGDGIVNEETNAVEYICVVCGEGRTVPLEDVSFTVSFDLNYDTEASSPPAQTVKYKSYAEEPERPEREGYTFAGWNEDPGADHMQSHFIFGSTEILSDLTLYAIWMENTIQLADGVADRMYIEQAIIPGLRMCGMDADDIRLSDDYDGDGLTLEEEYELDTSPFSEDFDEDGLSDYDEVKVYGTDPLKKDTDGDGLSDGKEVEYGSDPLTAETEFDVSTEFNDEKEINASVSIEGLTGEQADSLTVEKLEDDPLLPSDMPGYIDDGYDFSMDGTFEKAELKFRFDESLLSDPDFVPVIYYFDEEAQKLEALETAVEGNVATAETSHFSTYILLNSVEYEKAFDWMDVWQEGSYASADVVLVIDDSGSMTSNDRSSTRLAVARSLVDKLPENSRAAVVKFTGSVSVLQSLTADRDVLKSKLTTSFFYSSGGTHMYGGINSALGLFGEDSKDSLKAIVVLTDGETGYTSWHSSTLQSAKDKEVKIYTVGLGDSTSYFNKYLKPLAEETKGKFYYASQASELSAIYEDIGKYIDITTDTDEDGIADYFEEHMTLFNGVPIVLDRNDPDTDGDGLEDGEEIELDYDYSADGKKVKVTGKMYSDPTREDTDGDSLGDSTDPNPMKFDCVITDSTEESITFNSGRIWKKLPIAAQTWYSWNSSPNSGIMLTEQYQNILTDMISNESQNFSKEELIGIALVDNEGAKVYMTSQVSEEDRLEVFEFLVGRESKYYQHQGLLWKATWKEVPKETESGFFNRVVISEADFNLTTAAFARTEYDYLDLLNVAIITGAVILAIYLPPYVVAAFESITAFTTALSYYTATYGIIGGIQAYTQFQMLQHSIAQADVVNGFMQILELDLADGDLDGVDLIQKGIESGKLATPGFEAWLNRGDAVFKVYYGYEQGVERYVGITKQLLSSRLTQHLANGKPFDDLKQQFQSLGGLTRNQARCLEQYFIQTKFLDKLGNGGLNKINSIAAKHRYYYDAIAWAEKMLKLLQEMER